MDTSLSASEDASRDTETREIQKLALYGFLINLGLAGMKAVLAVVSGSLAVTASAIDPSTDSIASLILYGGLKLSTRKTKSFPMGLYKIENVISVVVAVFIFFAGYEIARHVFQTAAKPPDISIAIILWLFAGTAVTFLFGRYALAVGKRTESPTLKAEGRHRQADVLSSMVVLGSVVLNYFGLRFEIVGISLDQIAAAVVLIFIAHAGWELLSDGMRVLLDASVDFDTLDRVRNIIEAEPMVSDINSLVGRNAGRFRFLQADISMRTDDLGKAHAVTRTIEEKIRDQVPHVERVSIHYEPQPQIHARITLPLNEDRRTISTHFGESPYFAVVVVRRSDNEVEKKDIIENPHRDISRAKGIRVAEWLVEQKVDKVLVKEELKHKGPGYVFANAGIAVSVISAETVDDALTEITI